YERRARAERREGERRRATAPIPPQTRAAETRWPLPRRPEPEQPSGEGGRPPWLPSRFDRAALPAGRRNRSPRAARSSIARARGAFASRSARRRLPFLPFANAAAARRRAVRRDNERNSRRPRPRLPRR